MENHRLTFSPQSCWFADKPREFCAKLKNKTQNTKTSIQPARCPEQVYFLSPRWPHWFPCAPVGVMGREGEADSALRLEWGRAGGSNQKESWGDELCFMGCCLPALGLGVVPGEMLHSRDSLCVVSK